jgi:hypothetical protein
VFVRLDGVFLAPLVPAAALLIYGLRREAIRRVALAALVTAAPLAAWTARNAAEGVNVLPARCLLPSGRPCPAGYAAWANTWVETETEQAGATWSLSGEYDKIRIAPTAYRTDAERAQVEVLLAELRQHNGQPFPADIDQQFAALAQAHKQSETLPEKLGVLARRGANLWTMLVSTPVDQPGLPPGAPRPVKFKLVRLALIAATLAGAALWLWRGGGALGAALLMTGVYAVVRPFGLAFIGSVESRYMAELVPFLELCAGLTAAALWSLLISRLIPLARPARWRSLQRTPKPSSAES